MNDMLFNLGESVIIIGDDPQHSVKFRNQSFDDLFGMQPQDLSFANAKDDL